MNIPNAKPGRIVTGLLAVALTAALMVASVWQAPPAVYGQGGEAVQSAAATYSHAFTYQGHLNNAGVPVNDTCDLRFQLYDDPNAGNLLGTHDVPNVTLVDGLFTARLDFGAAAHTGEAHWLQISVRCPFGTGTNVTLTPRQELTAAPAALAVAVPFQASGDETEPLVSITNSGGNALAVSAPAGHGVYVESAHTRGVSVTSSDIDGVGIDAAGSHGVRVGTVGLTGLYIFSAGTDGVVVHSANDDGVYVFDVTNYAAYFNGPIYATGGCTGCLLTVFGRNAGDRALAAGDIVAIQGLEAGNLDNAAQLWNVVPAASGGTVVGVVSGRAEVDVARKGAQPGQGELGQRLVPRAGTALPGEYLTIVVSGPMQVRAASTAGAIGPGTHLTSGPDGRANPLRSVVVDSVTLSESAPSLGIALDAPDEDGLVWVLVNPQ